MSTPFPMSRSAAREARVGTVALAPGAVLRRGTGALARAAVGGLECGAVPYAKMPGCAEESGLEPPAGVRIARQDAARAGLMFLSVRGNEIPDKNPRITTISNCVLMADLRGA